MRSMRFVSILCSAAIVSLTALAGTQPVPGKVFGVTLTPEQQAKFKQINAEAEPAKKAVRDNAVLSEAEKRVQMKAVYDGIKAKLKAILTPEQVKEMEAFESAHPEMPAPGKVFGVMLTPEQQAKFKQFNAEAEPARKAIREDSKLSDVERRAQMKAVYDGIKAKLKAILTPAQVKEMEAAESARPTRPVPGKMFGVTLTPEQQAQFRQINAEAEPAKKAIRENTALSDAEKKTQMQAVYDGIKAKLKAILTPEQVKEMEAAEKK